MSYAVIEAAIATSIKGHADFDADNVSRGDFRVLSAGPDRAVILTFSAHRQEEVGIQIIKHTWTTNIDVLVPYRGELPELQTRLATEAQKVLDTLNADPRLGGASDVTKSIVINAGSPEPISAQKAPYRGHRYLIETTEILKPVRTS